MSVQEVIVAVIVGYAVLSLYKHVRALIGSAAPDADASCHGCDNCATETDMAPPPELGATPLRPESPRVP